MSDIGTSPAANFPRFQPATPAGPCPWPNLNCPESIAGAPTLNPATITFNLKQDIQTVMFGLNYRFGPSPVMAKY
jgi:hypothetical protein